MSKVIMVALREFKSIVLTKAFLIGLLVLPVMIVVGIVVLPLVFDDDNFSLEGEIAIVDRTGRVAAVFVDNLADEAAVSLPPELVGNAELAEALSGRSRVRVIERPGDADVELEKSWLNAEAPGPRRLALIVVDADAVEASGEGFGSYDFYVPTNYNARSGNPIHGALRRAIISERIAASGLDGERIAALTTVASPRSMTVSGDEESGTLAGFNMMLPFAFMFLLFMSVMGSGQGLLTTTIEEKSSRVAEVLLSAVSPMELMAGKLLGHFAVSMVGLSLYIALGLVALGSFSMLGLLEPMLIVYLFIFFVIAFGMFGSLMMAIGASVNDMSEAQTFMMPIMLLLVAPMFLWMPISMNPSSTLAVTTSFIPPINTFAMLLRVASTAPPPLWQVWLSILVGLVGVLAAVWVAAKLFRVGLLMFGKAPSFATLVRWVRAA